MAFPALIEVRTGPDRRLKLALWLIWFGALCSLLIHAFTLPLPLLLAGGLMLCWSVPRRSLSAMQIRDLKLHADGRVCCGDLRGNWQAGIWRSPWYTVISVQTGKRHWQAWISVTNNTADDYRRLGIWSRFAPHQTPKTAYHV